MDKKGTCRGDSGVVGEAILAGSRVKEKVKAKSVKPKCKIKNCVGAASGGEKRARLKGDVIKEDG